MCECSLTRRPLVIVYFCNGIMGSSVAANPPDVLNYGICLGVVTVALTDADKTQIINFIPSNCCNCVNINLDFTVIK